MATNKVRWVGNLDGAAEPLIVLGKFELGSTTAIKPGELLELTADTNTSWVPMDSDFAMDSNVAIANEEIKDGDRMGFYEIIVPRPGDIFEFELADASAVAVGTALYYSSSEKVTVTVGTNIIGYGVGQEHYPDKQGHLADDASGDAGETVKSTSYVRMCIRAAASYYSALVV
jgi:hypothetical protein